MNAAISLAQGDLAGCVDLAEVRKVVLVASSSRGGSSALAEWLRTKEGLISLDGELKPLLRQAGIDDPESDSDCIGEVEAGKIRSLRRLIVDALGVPIEPDAPFDAEGMIARSSRSISLQWPGVADESRIEHIIRKSLARIGWSRMEEYDAPSLMIQIIRELRELDARVCPYRYDLPGTLVSRSFPNALIPAGPPGKITYEETPFVLPRVARPPSMRDIENGAVAIKDPSNAYRMRLIRQLFPKAQIRVIHLVRNPAASINGLIDGWNHWNFFSRRLPGQLSIGGYSDRFPWGRDWWKFDLPPGWRSYSAAPLGQVCAFQWATTHRAIMENLSGVDHMRLKFENFIDNTEKGVDTRRELSEWLGIRCSNSQLSPPREVMVTQQPALARWRRRESEILDYVGFSNRFLDPHELGYGSRDSEWT
jgi:hypothetical protein